MKTTLYLEDALYRRAKIKALEEGRTVSDLVAEGLLLALNGILPSRETLQRVPLPRIESISTSLGGLTTDQAEDILSGQEAIWASRRE